MGHSRGLLVVAILSTAASVQLAAAATCPERSAEFDRAVAAGSLADVKRLEAAISKDSACLDDRQAIRDKRVAFELALAVDPAGPLRTDGEREAVLVDAAVRSDSWRASKALADFQARHRRFADAAGNYDTGIDRALQYDHPSDAERQELLKLAGAAKLLASDDRGGTVSVPLKLSSRAPNGTTGGIFSTGLMRGPTPVAVPLPIQFATASSVLTPAGKQAAGELAQALKEQGVTQATLIGHTDTRGGADFNMRLSQRRLQTVKGYLKDQGVSIDLSLVPKGLSEPFDVTVLPYRPTQEEAWALDRRVEWMRPPVER